MRTVSIAALAAATLALGACTKNMDTGATIPGGRTASALLRTSSGAEAGRATATEVAGGIRFTADIMALPAGTHGIHVHTTGACDAPGFTTAGGHWNPLLTKHGPMNPQGPHQGDLPNLILGVDGRGTVAARIPGATMDALLDADGAAMVVHAGADDLMTDPSGNSGGRIACGVFAAG
jgi:Cu-Zn family superoxide dismutase